MKITVGLGEIRVAKKPAIFKALGLGSCVAVVLYDENLRIGGMAHVMLPYVEESTTKSQPSKFADVAIAEIVGTMKTRGAQVRNMWAKLFGGANMFPDVILSDSTMEIGRRNISAAREELKRHHIQIVSEEVGGHDGRSILFNTCDGSVKVKSTECEERRY